MDARRRTRQRTKYYHTWNDGVGTTVRTVDDDVPPVCGRKEGTPSADKEDANGPHHNDADIHVRAVIG